MFKITPEMCKPEGKGFQITFDNEFTISVQFGAMSYVTRVDGGALDAEVAVLTGNGFVRLAKHDDVIARVPPNTVAELIFLVSTLPRDANEDYASKVLMAHLAHRKEE